VTLFRRMLQSLTTSMGPLPFAKYFKFYGEEGRGPCSTQQTPLKKQRYESRRHSSLNKLPTFCISWPKRMQDLAFARAGAAGGGDIRGVQLAECCKHAVGVRDDGHKAGEADDGAAGAAGGDDIRGVQLAGGCKHAVGVRDDGHKAGEADDGAAGAAGGYDIRGVQLAGCCKHAVGVCLCNTYPVCV
jgi:hypothetical protein